MRIVSLLIVGALVGCSIARVETRDPAEIPDGPLAAIGVDATGPIFEIGRGRTLGVGWRHAMFESAEGWCTQLELSGMAGTNCGDPIPPDGGVFGSIGLGTASDGVVAVEGIVAPEVAEAWLVTATGERIATMVLSIDETGFDGGAFVGIVPAEVVVTGVVAIDADGVELQTYDLPR